MSHIKLKRSIEMKVKSTREASVWDWEEKEEAAAAGRNNIYIVDIIDIVNRFKE